jgi:hypothetical protein
MKKIAHKTALHCIGWTLIFFGVLAGFLPFVPGFVFVALGIYILAQGWLWLWNHMENVKNRFPRFAYHYQKIDTRLNRFIKKAH